MTDAEKLAAVLEIITKPFADNNLSEHEELIVNMHALGYTNTEIAEETGLAESSVRIYRASGCRKIGIASHDLMKAMIARLSDLVK